MMMVRGREEVASQMDFGINGEILYEISSFK